MKGIFDDMQTTITTELPKHPVGTKFTWKRSRTERYDVEVIGYHIEHNTDTGKTDVTYRIKYNLGDIQIMTATVARSTVDMAVMGAK
jgi:deferrochelatase/peroxidase EfeB